MNLPVYGIYKGRDLNSLKTNPSLFKSKGVYIWGICKDDMNLVPLYVGVHNVSILSRVEQHFLSLHFGNKYRIFNEEFYESLLAGNNLIPLVSKISKIDQNKFYSQYKRFFDDCIFQCDPKFLRTKISAFPSNPKLRSLQLLDSKSITSQGYDYHFKYLTGFAIQDTIDTYFSEDRFGFALIPIAGDLNVSLSDLEANIKGSLLTGTLSNANNYNQNIMISITTQNPSKIDEKGIFNLDANNILKKNKYANEK